MVNNGSTARKQVFQRDHTRCKSRSRKAEVVCSDNLELRMQILQKIIFVSRWENRLTISCCSCICAIFLVYFWSTCFSSPTTPSQRSFKLFLSLISWRKDGTHWRPRGKIEACKAMLTQEKVDFRENKASCLNREHPVISYNSLCFHTSTGLSSI